MRVREIYTKIVLTIIALCLLVLVIQTGVNVASSPAEAARSSKTSYPKVDVFDINKITLSDIKEVIVLGDQHTFLVRTKDDIRVYRVDYIRE